MDFQLTDEQLQLKKSLRDFANREILPNVMKWDEASEFPVWTIKQLGRMGLLGMILPAEYGGAELGYVEYVLAVEELSAVDGSIGIIVAAHNSLCTNHIFLAGNEAQRKRYLPRLATGESLGAWGLTEPGSGSDAGSARTTAVRKGRPLGTQWQQDFHHQRPLCRYCRGDRRDGQDRAHARPLRFRRGEGDAGFSFRQEREQARTARQRYVRADL